MLKGKIYTAKSFQTSVNIAYDLYDDEKVKSFIPTMSAIDVIEDVMLSTSKFDAHRARILIGAYGRGKSHIILVLLALLNRKDIELFAPLLSKISTYNPQLYKFLDEYLKSKNKLLPIVVSGSGASLTQSFLNALQQALKQENLNDLMPETNFTAAINTIERWKVEYPETYNKFKQLLSESVEEFVLSLKEHSVTTYEKFEELYPSLTSGSAFNPFVGFDVVELYEKVIDKLTTRGFSGVFIVYDEFSKYLESSIANTSISDIKLLQDLAEKCDRSGSKQMHLMLISHKDIANYIDASLPKEKVDGWRGVSGRFLHVALHNNYSQMYEVISSVIKKDIAFWEEFCINNYSKFNDLIERANAIGMIEKADASISTIFIQGCYPLHPISTYLLPRLSEKVAQNERTLFTFLSSQGKHTLSSFLKDAEGEFPMLTPDNIYDYFEPLLRKEPYTSETYKLYRLTTNVLRKIEKNDLGKKIVKTISLIYLVEQFEKLPPTRDIIVETFTDSVNGIAEVDSVLQELIENDCIVYLKRSNNYLKLKESSGTDLVAEILKVTENNKNNIRVKDILNRASYDSYLYPTGYNDENDIVRYFNFTFIESDEFFSVESWNRKIEDIEADGVVYAVIPKNGEEIEKIKDAIVSGKHSHKRIVFVVPKKYVDIEKIALEYYAVKLLRAACTDDELLSDEYDIYIEDLSEVISNYIFSYTRPETNAADYYFIGEKHNLFRRAQLSALLSEICEKTYLLTPIINNESINKNVLPTVAINSRSKLISGILENKLDVNLGLTGTGQDVSFMRSTLIQTGILENELIKPTINLRPADTRISNMLEVIQQFLFNANNNSVNSFKVLYDQLTRPDFGIGLKKGVIPVYIATVFHHYKKFLVIKSRNMEVKITTDLLNGINENPENYTAHLESWNEEKAQYIERLGEIFKREIIEKEKDYNTFTYIVLSMSRWYMGLPKYAKEIKNVYLGYNKEPQFKGINTMHLKFLNSLKHQNVNARDYLFESIFQKFGYDSFDLNIIDGIRDAKWFFDQLKSELIITIIQDLKQIFTSKDKKEESLTSIIKNWYEDLNEETVNHLFARNEDKVLKQMSNIGNNEIIFVEQLARTLTGLRIEDWTDETIKAFLKSIFEFIQSVIEFNNKNKNDIHQSNVEMYKLILVQKNGLEAVKTFEKTNYSKRGKLLLNEISTAIEEMGQSISEQEKRQVLMELLEKMC